MSSTPQEMIERLTQEVGTLRQTNLVLQDRVDRMVARPQSPDDLAAALQRTVDGLQTRLASLSNPISNFAVKDFRLETNLAVAITPLGTLEYRLLQPGDNIDPHAISKLTLSLVPIEKQRPEGTLPPASFDPNKDLAVIGVSDALRQTLEENHIFTIGDFRSAALRTQVRASLIATERTTQQELAQLQARAELAMLPGVDGAVAEMLIAANVDSLQAIARSSAEGLVLVVKDLELADAERWVAAAQSFTGVTDTTQRVVRIDANPPGLYLRFGEEQYTSSAVVRQLTIRKPLSVSTFRAQLIGNTGYAFERWSNGATSPRLTLAVPESVTARFRVACNSVIASSVSAGGVLLIEPRVGGVPGFPANCYAPGTAIELVAKPDLGFVLESLTITAGGKTSSVNTPRISLTVDGPIVARARFIRGPNIVIPSRGAA